MSEFGQRVSGLGMRARLAILFGLVLVALLGTGGYILHVRGQQQAAAAGAPPPASAADLAAVTAVPHLVFRNTALGGQYGYLALVPLSAPDGPRAVVAESCDRVYARRS